MLTTRTFFLIPISVWLLTSCVEKSVEHDTGGETIEIDSNRTNIVNVSGKLFSIPSPVQTAMLIKESNADYAKEKLNEPGDLSRYATNSSRAVNLGIYGTEMAYSSLYDDGQAALRYFRAVEKLANELGISGAIDTDLVQRLGANAGNADSLLILSGKFYEEADAYLKENERYDVAALVLLGGWIEASYLTTLAAEEGLAKARKRLAEQKEPLETLREVLEATADQGFLESATVNYVDSLSEVYADISYSYTYAEPETLPDRKITYIKSKSDYDMTDAQLDEISRLLNQLREEVIR